jgi:DNA replication and repair protein RecF
MAFSSLRTVNFRNLVDAETLFPGRDVFLVGENGQGKTNFLEALYYCAYGSSFRGTADSALARHGEKSLAVEGSLASAIPGRIADTVAGALEETIKVKFSRGKKTVEYGGKKVADRKELLEAAPTIVFCHEDLKFVQGSPEERRWFFDQCLSLYDPLYLDNLRRYRRVLKTRNLVYKESRYGDDQSLNAEGNALLDSLDGQLADYGLVLMEKRKRAASDFSAVFTPLFRAVSGTTSIGVTYNPSWKPNEGGVLNKETIMAHLLLRRSREKLAGVSLSGPHRDKYLFYQIDDASLTETPAAEYSLTASTGQRRLLALLLRVAQARLFTQETGKPPVLLLDDVLLELDPEKRRRFLENLPDYAQAFYTFLPEEPIDRYRKEDTVVYHVESGRLRE